MVYELWFTVFLFAGRGAVGFSSTFAQYYHILDPRAGQ